MFAVVDTWNKPHEQFGRVISRHRTLVNALKAENKLARQKYPGFTVLVELKKNVDVIPCYWTEMNEMVEHMPCLDHARPIRMEEVSTSVRIAR
jgi:hypothetical protein